MKSSFHLQNIQKLVDYPMNTFDTIEYLFAVLCTRGSNVSRNIINAILLPVPARLFEIKLYQRLESVMYVKDGDVFVITEGEAARYTNFYTGECEQMCCIPGHNTCIPPSHSITFSTATVSCYYRIMFFICMTGPLLSTKPITVLCILC